LSKIPNIQRGNEIWFNKVGEIINKVL